MANLTGRVVADASRDSDERQEWLPPQIERELGRPFFTRLTTTERLERRGQPDEPTPPKRTRRFAPTRAKAVVTAPPEPAPATESVGSEMLRRLSEVEASVASAAQAVDRSASNVRTLVASNGQSG